MKLPQIRFDRSMEAGLVVAAIGVAALGTYTHWSLPLLLSGAGLFTLILLSRPVLGLFLIAFFLPFERIGAVDIGGITVRIHQLLALASLAAWVVSGLLRKKWQLSVSLAYVPLLLLFTVAVVGYLNAPNPERTLTVTLFTLFTVVAGMVLPILIQTRSQLETYLRYLFVGALLVSLFGVFQFVGDFVGLPTEITGLRDQYTKDILGFPRVQSTTLEPLYFANYLFAPLFVALALFLSKQTVFTRWKLLGLTSLLGLNVFLTVSRGAYIGLGVGLAVLGVLYFRRFLKPGLAGGIAGVGLIAVVVGSQLLRLQDVFENFWEHTVGIFAGASFVERVDTFQIAVENWRLEPWFGFGMGSFGPLAAHQPYAQPETGWAIVNNEYLELLVETGVLGLGFFLLFLVMVLWQGWGRGRKMDSAFTQAVVYGLIAALVATAVQYNTFSVLFIMHIWILIGLLHRLTNSPIEDV